MAERYSKLFALPQDLYAKGAPVIVRAGALLMDTVTAKPLAQLKLQSIANVMIKQLTVQLHLTDAEGQPLENAVTHTYIDLNAMRNAEFGAQTPVFLSQANARAFSVQVTEVAFTDGTAWRTSGEVWSPLPTQKPLESLLQSPESLAEYQRLYGESARRLPVRERDLWLCTCGAVNSEGEELCNHCGQAYAQISQIDPEALSKDHQYQRAVALLGVGSNVSVQQAIEIFTSLDDWRDSKEQITACEAKLQENAAQKKKNKKIAIISLSSLGGVLACVALLIFLIIPTVQYNKALKMYESGDKVAAYQYLIGSLAIEYKGKARQLQDSARDEMKAEAAELIDQGEYQAAVDILKGINYYHGGFNVSSENPNLLGIASAMISKDYSAAAKAGMTHMVIPSGETEIKSFAFYECAALESIVLPDTVTSIDNSAFKNCSALESITLSQNLKTIGESAFEDCNSLKSITLPATLTKIGKGAFIGCTQLEGITVPAGVTKLEAKTFSGCTALKWVSLPAGITEIGEDVFYNCTALTSITIPAAVKQIGKSAFTRSGLENASFAVTTGWKRVGFSYRYTYSITATDLANTATAANYLRSEYNYYTWKRS